MLVTSLAVVSLALLTLYMRERHIKHCIRVRLDNMIEYANILQKINARQADRLSEPISKVA